MYRKITKRYIDRTVKYLPVRDRRKARTVIEGTILANLEDYTAGRRPTAGEVKLMLREMGRPRDVADAYYREFHKPLFFRLNIRKIFDWVMRLITVAAVLLVAVGVVGLILGADNTGCIVTGTILAIPVVFYQMAAAPGEKYVIPNARR